MLQSVQSQVHHTLVAPCVDVLGGTGSAATLMPQCKQDLQRCSILYILAAAAPCTAGTSPTICCLAAKHPQSSDGISRCIVIAVMMQCRKQLHTQAVLVCMSHATVICGIMCQAAISSGKKECSGLCKCDLQLEAVNLLSAVTSLNLTHSSINARAGRCFAAAIHRR